MNLKRNLLFKLSAISALFLISCGTSQRVLDARENALFNKWIGHSKNQLVSQWGRPDSVSTDGKNGQILLYKEKMDYVSVMNGNYTGLQYSIKKEMFVNADSLIYTWKAWRRK